MPLPHRIQAIFGQIELAHRCRLLRELEVMKLTVKYTCQFLRRHFANLSRAKLKLFLSDQLGSIQSFQGRPFGAELKPSAFRVAGEQVIPEGLNEGFSHG